MRLLASWVTLYGHLTGFGQGEERCRSVISHGCSSIAIGAVRADEKGGLLGFDRRKIMHQEHRKAAAQHVLAAKSHRTAAEHHEKGDDEGGRWPAERALEYSDQAYK